MTEKPKKPRGFAALKLKNPERVLQIASMGGRTAHAKGTAHKWDATEASRASMSRRDRVQQDVGRCPWCGQMGVGLADSERPVDYCHHDPADLR